MSSGRPASGLTLAVGTAGAGCVLPSCVVIGAPSVCARIRSGDPCQALVAPGAGRAARWPPLHWWGSGSAPPAPPPRGTRRSLPRSNRGTRGTGRDRRSVPPGLARMQSGLLPGLGTRGSGGAVSDGPGGWVPRTRRTAGGVRCARRRRLKTRCLPPRRRGDGRFACPAPQEKTSPTATPAGPEASSPGI